VIDVRQVTLGGELGRRVEITIEGHLLKLDPNPKLLTTTRRAMELLLADPQAAVDDELLTPAP